MSCRKTVCLECSTQWDGVNYCVSCLSEKRASHDDKGSVLAWLSMLLLIAILAVAGSFAMVWSGALLARIISSL